MSRRIERLDFIFDVIAKGKTADEIQEALDKRASRGKVFERRGEKSEQKVYAILSELDFVRRVERTEKNSPSDRMGRDLKVSFSKKRLGILLAREPAIKLVWVQVKSSRVGVETFRVFYGETDEEIQDALSEERLVVINASDSVETIEQSFYQQAVNIDEYWQSDFN